MRGEAAAEESQSLARFVSASAAGSFEVAARPVATVASRHDLFASAAPPLHFTTHFNRLVVESSSPSTPRRSRRFRPSSRQTTTTLRLSP